MLINETEFVDQLMHDNPELSRVPAIRDRLGRLYGEFINLYVSDDERAYRDVILAVYKSGIEAGLEIARQHTNAEVRQATIECAT